MLVKGTENSEVSPSLTVFRSQWGVQMPTHTGESKRRIQKYKGSLNIQRQDERALADVTLLLLWWEKFLSIQARNHAESAFTSSCEGQNANTHLWIIFVKHALQRLRPNKRWALSKVEQILSPIYSLAITHIFTGRHILTPLSNKSHSQQYLDGRGQPTLLHWEDGQSPD